MRAEFPAPSLIVFRASNFDEVFAGASKLQMIFSLVMSPSKAVLMSASDIFALMASARFTHSLSYLVLCGSESSSFKSLKYNWRQFGSNARFSTPKHH